MSHTITDKQITEAVAKLDALDGIDPESEHVAADGVMFDLLPFDVREAVENAERRANGWWFA